MEAADRVDSTAGVQMAYLKQWAKRAHKDLELRMPDVLPGRGQATQLEAAEAAAIPADLVYLDPPYNQHSYMGNYHIWETLVRWDHPEAYGVAQKRIECRSYKSPFNSKRRIHDALREAVRAVRSPHMLVSFNNEGHVAREDMEEILSERGEVRVVEFDFPRYVGAKIGIYNPSGKKVGRVSHTRNKELLFLVSERPEFLDRAADAIAAASTARMR
jgi:adenine-specific DNA-methyltransferase